MEKYVPHVMGTDEEVNSFTWEGLKKHHRGVFQQGIGLTGVWWQGGKCMQGMEPTDIWDVIHTFTKLWNLYVNQFIQLKKKTDPKWVLCNIWILM